MKRSISLAFLLAFLLCACGSAARLPRPTSLPPRRPPHYSNFCARPRTLNVFAAASLTDAFKEIGQAFDGDHSA